MTKKEEAEQRRRLRLEKERERVEALCEIEKQYDFCANICGIDEVGRGPFAGPVMAGAVILPKDARILHINDSKKLSEAKRIGSREKLAVRTPRSPRKCCDLPSFFCQQCNPLVIFANRHYL